MVVTEGSGLRLLTVRVWVFNLWLLDTDGGLTFCWFDLCEEYKDVFTFSKLGYEDAWVLPLNLPGDTRVGDSLGTCGLLLWALLI